MSQDIDLCAMKILITGGAGCLGTNLIDHWNPKEHTIAVIDNFVTGHKASLADYVEVHEGSVVDASFVERVFEAFRPECVIHCAASYSDPDDWEGDALTNIVGAINILNASRDIGVKRFVNLQTALCYGIPRETPIRVDHPISPFTSYGISKSAGEHYVLMSELNVVSLRLANITGPRLAIGPIPTFYNRLKNEQSCFCTEAVRDFLDIEDFLELMDIVISDTSGTGVFNVSTGEGHSIKEIYDVVRRYLEIDFGEDAPILPVGDDDVPVVVLDATKTKAVFGWEPKVDFESMMYRMLRWYDENGVTAVYSHLKGPKE